MADPVGPVEGGEAILIRTHIQTISPDGSAGGDVLTGSFIGDSPFCPGGRVHSEHGSPGVGLVHTTFVCPDGRLSVGFSPTQHSLVQSSTWKVVDGIGRFEGLRGQGWMVARFERVAEEGRETFTGTVTQGSGTP